MRWTCSLQCAAFLLCLARDSLGVQPALVSAGPSQIQNLLVFGSSLSDTGNQYRRTFNLIPPTTRGYYQGRFSDGPVWPDHLQQQLGGVQVSSYAYGGAKACGSAGGLTAILGMTSPSLPDQLNMMRRQMLGKRPAVKSTVAVIVIGVNDLYELLEGSKDQDYETLVKPAAAKVAGCILNASISLLSDNVAKQVVVANTYPLQLMRPWLDYATEGMSSAQASAFVARAKDTANFVNTEIREQVTQLQLRQLLRINSAKLSLWDIHADITKVIKSANSSTTSQAPCLTTIPFNSPYLPTSRVTRNCLDKVKSSSGSLSHDASKSSYIWWDYLHFATDVHKTFAASVQSLLGH